MHDVIDDNLTDCNVGSRKRRNIRDNLFVINVISNEAKCKSNQPCDICVYDVRKCYDTLWLQECINDLWEAGFQDDKLVLLYLENKTAQIAVKTASGTTERIAIQNKIMQGTIWAGLMCTTTMDKLGKEIYADPTLVYKYRGSVDVPPLEMVDDVISASKCGPTTVAPNASVNSFVERKKLKLSADKCVRIHIGNKSSNHQCPPLKVHTEEMKNSEREKYLIDFVTTKANANETLVARKTRAYAILSEIRAILKEIPLGKWKLEIGLALRDAWFLNGILYNCEVWNSYADKHIEDLNVIDHMILKTILGAQSKVPTETLYLETSTLSIKHVISVRRMLYLKNILSKHENKVVQKVYNAMKSDPLKGDWYNLLVSDFKKIGMEIDESKIKEVDLITYKKHIKTSVWNVFFNELQEKKLKHTKVMNIEYDGIRTPQPYLLNHNFDNEMCSLLFNLRCKSVNNFRDNFHTWYGKEPPCRLCLSYQDSQEHALVCEVIRKELKQNEIELLNKSYYSQVYGNIEDQLNITRMYQLIISIRERLLATPQRQGLPGIDNSGPD